MAPRSGTAKIRVCMLYHPLSEADEGILHTGSMVRYFLHDICPRYDASRESKHLSFEALNLDSA